MHACQYDLENALLLPVLHLEATSQTQMHFHNHYLCVCLYFTVGTHINDAAYK